jgi:hypothetical protein
MPAGDVDVLFHQRAGVDAWFEVLRLDVEVETAPEWIEDANQYFARLVVDGVNLELSTVEFESESDTVECFGAGPWQHYDVIPCGTLSVPCVATELRLLTELARSREDRSRPIIDFLRTTGANVPLIHRGLANLGATQSAIDQVVAELSPVAGA